jgi:hypothetical protein
MPEIPTGKAKDVADAAPKRKPGRPKGLPKTGGRKRPAPIPVELREYIHRRGRPLELLNAIASGRKVQAADPENPGAKKSVYPTLPDRIAAARVLLAKVAPDLRATELTGAEGKPLIPEPKAMSNFEIARRLAFILRSAKEEQAEAEARAHGPVTITQPRPEPEP